MAVAEQMKDTDLNEEKQKIQNIRNYINFRFLSDY